VGGGVGLYGKVHIIIKGGKQVVKKKKKLKKEPKK